PQIHLLVLGVVIARRRGIFRGIMRGHHAILSLETPGLGWWSDSEVRKPSRHVQIRTSESKDHQQRYDASAPFEPEVRDRICRTVGANFGFGALAFSRIA